MANNQVIGGFIINIGSTWVPANLIRELYKGRICNNIFFGPLSL